jgi:hypothetical protein
MQDNTSDIYLNTPAHPGGNNEMPAGNAGLAFDSDPGLKKPLDRRPTALSRHGRMQDNT